MSDPTQIVQDKLSPYYLSGQLAVVNNITAVNRYRIRSETADPAMNGPYYVFVTSPSCNIEISDGMNWSDSIKVWNNYPNIKILIDNLCWGVSGHGNQMPILTVLTNCVENFTPVDTSSQTITVGETWSKLKMTYAGPDNDSKSGGSFNLEFQELDGMPCTIINKIWYDYSQAVRIGLAKPTDDARNKRYVDYMSSMYFFQLAPDGMSINYWCRYTGVFPTGMPYSSFSGKAGSDIIRISVPYSFMFKDDMELETLHEFNKVFNPGMSDGGGIMNKMRGFFGSSQKYYASGAYNVSSSKATKPGDETFMSTSPFVYWRTKEDKSVVPCLDFGPGSSNPLFVFQSR